MSEVAQAKLLEPGVMKGGTICSASGTDEQIDASQDILEDCACLPCTLNDSMTLGAGMPAVQPS